MKRFSTIAALALLTVACSEPATAPASPGSSGAAYALGNPPPPPLSGGGSAFLSLGDEVSLESLRAPLASTESVTEGCNVNFEFGFSYDYFLNKPGNNAFLHITEDGVARKLTIHQHGKNLGQGNDDIEVNGAIVGDGFTFTIDGADAGQFRGASGIVNQFHRFAGAFAVQVAGTLTFTDGRSCQVSGNLTGDLNGEGDSPE